MAEHGHQFQKWRINLFFLKEYHNCTMTLKTKDHFYAFKFHQASMSWKQLLKANSVACRLFPVYANLAPNWKPATPTSNQFKMETCHLRSQLREQSCIVTNTKAPSRLLPRVLFSCGYAVKLLWRNVEDVYVFGGKNNAGDFCTYFLYTLESK